VIKSTRVRWPEHVAHTEERRKSSKSLVGNWKERDHSENLGVDRRIMLNFNFRKQVGGCGLN
jgi:hypothetical protein